MNALDPHDRRPPPARAVRRPDRDDRLRLDRPRHAAADRAPHRLRPLEVRRDRAGRHRPRAARRAQAPLREARDHPGELPRGAHPAAHRRAGPRHDRQPVGRHLLGRPDGPLQGHRRASTSTRCASRGRASTPTQGCRSRSARTTRCARACSTCAAAVRAASRRSAAAAPIPAWCRGWSSRRCSTSRATLELDVAEPTDARGLGAADAQRLGVKGIHIAERDTQRARDPKPRGMFVNTWSVEGFVSEGLQPAELGWGTHEKALPAGRRTGTISAATPRST